MRLVASLTVPDCQTRVLEHEWPPFFGVALRTGLLARESGSHLVPLDAGVRLMAVDALDGAFPHSVMKGFGEVATLGNMAAEAEIGGRLLQQTGQAGTPVNAMAVGA